MNAPFDGSCIYISAQKGRAAFRKAFHRAKASSVIPRAAKLEHVGEGWFAVSLTLTELAALCQLNGFTLTSEEAGCTPIVITEAA